MRTPFPRSRGGRGPQIGPGTFEGRVAPPIAPGDSATRPDRFQVVTWAAGPDTPSVEIWCFHQGWHDLIAYMPGVTRSFFIDKVDSATEFAPPSGSAPDGLATLTAFREYARSRYFDKFDRVTSATDWRLQVSYPAAASTVATMRKLANGIYHVSQRDRSTAATPLAWVWVRDDGARETWLHFRPNQVSGFHYPGTQPDGATEAYNSSELRFVPINPNVPPGFPWGGTLQNQIDKFKMAAINDAGSPVTSVLDLEVLDLFIDEIPI